MAKNKLGYLVLSDEQERTLVGFFHNPASTELFVRLLDEVKRSLVAEQSKSAQAFLMNSDPITRALALQQKGQITMLDELVSVIKNVTK